MRMAAGLEAPPRPQYPSIQQPDGGAHSGAGRGTRAGVAARVCPRLGKEQGRGGAALADGAAWTDAQPDRDAETRRVGHRAGVVFWV